MPDFMLKFLAHVEVYKVVLARWENDDYSEHTAYINFPEYLGPYVSETLRQQSRRRCESGACCAAIMGFTLSRAGYSRHSGLADSLV